PQQSRARSSIIIVAQSCTLAAIIFLILVLLENTINTHILTSIYFLSIDASQVIPRSYPNAMLVNSIAQTLGLRGFYQVGLWNYCEGYKAEGVTFCGTPKPLYCFDPVTKLLSQLMAGATIAIPSNITDALSYAKTASHWMFACFFVGIGFLSVSFVIGKIDFHFLQLVTLSNDLSGWVGSCNRRNSYIVGVISFIAGLFTTVGATVSTVLYVVFRRVFESAPEFNIRANLGERMYIFVWLAVGFVIAAFIVNTGACC
ncbi:hypothetical protein K440DRAFT_485912, partial [Wilcoxina mikolae CBS 423.85]